MVSHSCYFEYFIIPFDKQPYNGDSDKISKMVFVRSALSKDELVFKNVVIFVQKAGLIWRQGGFSLN